MELPEPSYRMSGKQRPPQLFKLDAEPESSSGAPSVPLGWDYEVDGTTSRGKGALLLEHGKL